MPRNQTPYHDSEDFRPAIAVLPGLCPGPLDDLLRLGLREDGWLWDWTTLGTVREGSRAARKLRARVIAKSEGIWAGGALLGALSRVAGEMGGTLRVRARVPDGAGVSPKLVVCEWVGPARQLLALERPFLNLAAYASGIATRTRRLVLAVEEAFRRGKARGKRPRVCSTRKTLPGYRDLAIHAIRVGGGHPHRLGLGGGVLIKENHIAAAGGIARAVGGARAAAPHGLKIEIEVRDLGELRQALAAGAEGVLLDNFSPAEVSRALVLLEDSPVRPVIEVSGGISEANIGRYALPGVDVISVGSLTHSVTAVDLSLLVVGL
jgi:nicotinate-nucleotide pyrophosphorylase (carboxylating)